MLGLRSQPRPILPSPVELNAINNRRCSRKLISHIANDNRDCLCAACIFVSPSDNGPAYIYLSLSLLGIRFIFIPFLSVFVNKNISDILSIMQQKLFPYLVDTAEYRIRICRIRMQLFFQSYIIGIISC